MTSPAGYFHLHSNPNYWHKLLGSAVTDGRISKPDAALVRQFIIARQGGKGITPGRAAKLSQILISWRQVITTPWQEVTIDDLYNARLQLSSMPSSLGKPYAQNTIVDHIQTLKSFYRWMISRGLTTALTLDELRELKPPPRDYETTAPEDLITTDELAAMIRACKSHRDRAIIAVTYETGARIGEIARLRWSNVRFDKYGVKCTLTDTKTGGKRHPRLINSTTYLAAWRNGYYGPAAEGDAYVFISENGNSLKYPAISLVIKRAAQRAGLKKPIHPHLLRKSRITELVRKNYQESVIKEIFWSNTDTSMFRTYLRLSEKDIDDEFLRMAGLLTEHEINADNDKPRQCAYCLAVNPPGSQYCRMCTRPLTSAARDEQEQRVSSLLDRMDQDPRLAVIEQRIEELRKELIADLD